MRYTHACDIARKLGELMENAWTEPRSQEDDGVYKGT